MESVLVRTEIPINTENTDFFYKNIEDLERSEDKYAHLFQEKIRIISSVINNVNSIIHELLIDTQKVRENINQIKEQFRRTA